MYVILVAWVLLALALMLPPTPGLPLTVRYRRMQGAPPHKAAPRRKLLAYLPVGPLVGVLPRGYRNMLQTQLLKAHMLDHWTLAEFVAVKCLVGMMLSAATLLIWFTSGATFLLAGAVMELIAGWSLPDFVLKRRSAARLDAVGRELPTMLSSLAICLQTGLSLRSALQYLADVHQEGVLRQELLIVAAHLQAGANPREALTAMMERCGTPQLNKAINTLLQHAEVSPSSAGAAAAEESRLAWQEKKRRAEIMAHSASLKLFLPQMLLGLPALLLVLMGPAVIGLWDTIRSMQ